jgi:radical SAM protein with 4Fe4S-binding SPASM domain
MAGIDPTALQTKLEELWKGEGIDYSNFVDLREYYGDSENVFGRSRCLAPWHELTIRENGDVYPCMDLPDYLLGNILESNFTDIWEGVRANRFRELLKTRRLWSCNRCRRLFTHFW